jgi:hypothetical protein
MGRKPGAGSPGTRTLSDESLKHEQHPELHPQSPGELAHKIKEEAAEGEGIGDKAKRIFEELDRDIAGEYERREDPSAPPANT